MCKTSPREGRAAGDRNGQTVAPQPRLLCGDNDPNFFHTPRRVPSYVARHMAKPAAAPFVSGTNGIASCGERSSIHATDSRAALIRAWFVATRTMPHFDHDLVLEEQLSHAEVDPADRVGYSSGLRSSGTAEATNLRPSNPHGGEQVPRRSKSTLASVKSQPCGRLKVVS